MSLLAVWLTGGADESESVAILAVAVWISLLAVWLSDCMDESVRPVAACLAA